ncbi:MAG: S8 family serine peptidase [Gammaproteobacteria bacterium]|nr:S8 family serine peptidase [Gammaproteobacteria bacterium]
MDVRLTWPTVVTVAILLSGFALLLALEHSSTEGDGESLPVLDRATIDAAASRIAAESRGASRPLVVEAPPIASGGNGRSSGDIERTRPVPPDGYSFVVHHGQMARDRIERVGGDGQESPPGPSWLDSPHVVDTLAAQASRAGRDWTFGWIRLAEEARLADLASALEDLSAEVVGASGRMVRARLPGDASLLEAILGLRDVAGAGAAPPAGKLAGFADDPVVGADGPTPVFVTLMADDGAGRWRRTMEDLGAVVGGYDPVLRVYRAVADGATIQALANFDFVQGIEPVRVVQAAHDTAVPAMGADALRTYDGSPGLFSGTVGASVPVGVMDTGLNINHLDIASHRDSICGANFVDWDPIVEAEDLWIDAEGHGTHVTGTIVGTGDVEPRFVGMAPGVRHIRFAKVLDRFGFGSSVDIRNGMDFLAGASGCGGAAAQKPLVVNMSLSARSRTFEGRDHGARKLDSTVWTYRQLYVVAQANSDIHGFSNYGAAKNSLAVGAATDGGSLAWFSSHGPTADGRLAPNVVGTGVRVHSARGDGSRGRYDAFDGTSMASPSVAGVAALLMDAVPAHKENPALARARLMASAIRPDPWLEADAGFPMNNTGGPGPIQARYGMGKVSARTAVLNRDQQDGWRSGSASTELEDGQYAYHDIEVPVGASRLDLVMTWDEPPADAVASTVLNDLDLWLDRDADCADEACGEHSSRSRIDNVEWIVVRNPEPGTYRAKVLGHRIYTEAPRAAIAWTVIRGASTPTLAVDVDRERIEGEGEHELTLTMTADAYVAAGVRLHIDCRSEVASTCADLVTIESAVVLRADGLRVDRAESSEGGYITDPGGPIKLGASIPVGELTARDELQVMLRVSLATDDSARLHFAADAWNARAGTATVAVGPGVVAEVAVPANHDFAAAGLIEGAEGNESLDLLLATVEPGEPVVEFEAQAGRPNHSVWYSWTAPADGPFRFGFALSREDYPNIESRIDLHVYVGNQVAALREVASARQYRPLWRSGRAAAFFAEAGRVYRIRVASSSRGVPLTLRWLPGRRPANDDFADAIVLDGESGSVDGTGVGATLEPGEPYGAATTWFRWTAPRDGGWQFSGPNYLDVYEGDDIAGLRLVSNESSSGAPFPAGAGREYRIAVSYGDDYSLDWSPHGTGMSASLVNDAFAEAEPIRAEAASSHAIRIDGDTTVEPGEPLEAGIRTAWWSWEAPLDDLYTWRLRDASHRGMQATAFAGERFDDIQLVARTSSRVPDDLVLDATAGERYWFAAGLGLAVRGVNSASADLVWGPTPDNDEVVEAAIATGASGSVTGSNEYATGASGERSDILGRSTLWWTYEAPASGWVRFAVDGDGGPWALTVHRDSPDGPGGLGVFASDRWQRAENEVLFEARAGVRYTIALGVRGGGPGGEFTLRWNEADDPGWLRYIGRLLDGHRDSRGNPVEMRNPGDLAMHASGTALYMASSIGLQVFERDATTGGLDHVQLLETDFDLSRAALLWDPHRNRLVADDCDSWRSFAPVGAGLELEDLGDLAATDDPQSCFQRNHVLLMDDDGSDIYRVAPPQNNLAHFAVDDAGGLRFVGEEPSVRTAVLSQDGEHLYAASLDELLVFTRDAETGALSRTDFEEALDLACCGPWPMAITDDDAYLFVFERHGEPVSVFSVEDPLNPERLDTLPQFWDGASLSWGRKCRFADTRSDSITVDAFCVGLAFTVRWDAEARQLSDTGWISGGESDAFNGLPLPDFEGVAGLAVSPDDRHVYLSTPQHGILILAREGPPAVADGPDLVVAAPSVDNAAPEPGAAFVLSATIRNLGGTESAATTLRFYRSADAMIANGDAEVGSSDVPGVPAFGASEHSIKLTAPSEAGTYHYGACVDEVADESVAANNCSTAVAVSVAGDDHGDTLDAATSVSVPSTTGGELEEGGDKDYFRFEIATAGTLTVETAGSTDTYGTLFDSDQKTLETDDDDGPGRNFKIERDVGAGTHYVEVRGYSSGITGTYELTVEFSSGGGSPDLVAESVAASNANPDPGASFTLDASVRNAGDGDAAATTLRYYRSDDAAISTGDAEVGADAVPALAADATSAESISLTAPSAAGTYYYGACVDTVSGESDTGNNCSGSVAVEVSDGGASTDDHGDTVDTATTVSTESSTTGELEEGGDLDYFRVQVRETVALTVWTSGDTDTYGTLFDADGGSLETDDDDGSGTNFEMERELEAGTYFLEVRGFSASTTGSYRLNASTMYGGLALELVSCSDVPVGITLGHDAEQAALDTAAGACEDDGGSASACSSNTLAFRRCGAIVYGESQAGTRCHVNGYSIFASTRTAAEDVALEVCRSEGRTGCRILADDGGERMSGCNGDSGSTSPDAADLVVESPSVDDDTPDKGDTITLSATVRNSGDGASETTTLRYYRSSNAAISSNDTEVGTDPVAGLAAGADSTESISLTVPSDAGTYYYGACVDSVSGESDTVNNCSDGVEVEVSDGGGGDSYCRDDDKIEPGNRCDIYDTSNHFQVNASGRGCADLFGSLICAGNRLRQQNGSILIDASRNDDDSWTIDDVEPEP